MAILTKEQILAASKNRKVQEIELERFGGSVRIREMSTAEILAFRKETRDAEEEEGALHLLVHCWVDEDDARVFSGPDAIAEVAEIPLDVLNELTTAVLEVNGMGKGAVEEAGKG